MPRLPSFMLALALMVGSLTHTQAGPEQPLVIVVPAPAGGSTDASARALAQELARQTGRTVIVDNVAGEGGAKGAARALSAKPDGNTILLLNSSAAAAVIRDQSKPRLAESNFLTSIGRAPQLLAVPDGSPYKSVTGLLNAPSGITLASPGQGSVSNFNAAELVGMAGVKSSVVPYKGVAPALGDLTDKQVTAAFLSAESLKSVPQGKLRPLAVTGDKRFPLLPDVPTFKELGMDKSFRDDWLVLAAPSGLPEETKQQLSQALAKAVEASKPSLAVRGVEVQTLKNDQFLATLSPPGFSSSTGGSDGSSCPTGRCWCKRRNSCQASPCNGC